MFPSEGSNLTPAHHFPDFRLKTYAPLAFRYFRELFGIKPDDYLVRVTQHHYSDSAQCGKCFTWFNCSSCLIVLYHSQFQYSICKEPLIELSNPGASSSWFYLTSDDEFIIKTVQHKEAEFLQKLLPGYYMVSSFLRPPLQLHVYQYKYAAISGILDVKGQSFISLLFIKVLGGETNAFNVCPSL